MNKTAPFTTIIYALLVIILGIMGYQAGSTISMIMGIISGILLLICSYFIIMERRLALYFAILISAILLVVFCIRFGKTTDFMPAAMALFSFIIIVLLLSLIGKFPKRE